MSRHLVVVILAVLVLLLCIITKARRARKRLRSQQFLTRDATDSCRILSREPWVLVMENLLSSDECGHLINIAEPILKPSSTVAGQVPSRTSYSAFLPAQPALEARLRRLLRRPLQLEGLQVVRYHPGQEFRPHYDYFTKEIAQREGGQRLLTYFVYLNDLPTNETGGATVFPKLNLSVRPETGTAVIFSNALEDDSVDDRLLHGGEPTVTSTKYGLNVFWRG